MKSRTKCRNVIPRRWQRVLLCEPLEVRRVLAASVGWDGPGLGSAQLTYHIANSPSSLSSAETRAAVETALAAWASVADITFTPTTQRGRSDSIDISFGRIDGPGGTLAQAYFPDDLNPARLAGDVQFDSSEVWEVGNSLGSAAFDLVWVAVHEIGHTLGLDHLSSSAASVLAPYVSPNQAFVSLANVDIAAIQNLYATAGETLSPVDTSTTTTVTPREPTDTGDADDNQFPTHRWRSLLGPTAEQLMARFDADGDGNLIESEVPARAWEKFTDQAVDGDEDGEVTLSELEAAMAAARASIFAELDFDSDGLLVETELDSNLWSKVSAADSDSDSSISMEEFDVWVVEQQSNRPERGVRQGTEHGRHSPSVDTVFAQFPSRLRRR